MTGQGQGPGQGDGEKPPLKVTDKRSFTPEGKLREETRDAEGSSRAEERPAEAQGPGSEPEEIDFTTFLLSLAANAMHHLGEGPEGPVGKPNLPLAKQTIDIVALLQSKTRGNLSGEEERLLEGILYDLRMRFVAATRRKGAPDASG
jgi:hypothetical protein